MVIILVLYSRDEGSIPSNCFMYKNSIRSLILLELVKEGWYVENGILYNPKKEKHDVAYTQNGYKVFCKHLKGNNKVKSNVVIHCLVAYQKFGEQIFDLNYPVHIRHLDGDKLNNAEANIAIGTQSENMMDRSVKDRFEHSVVASSYLRRFSATEIKSIIADRKAGYTYAMLCKKYNTCRSTLSYFFNEAYYVKLAIKENEYE